MPGGGSVGGGRKDGGGGGESSDEESSKKRGPSPSAADNDSADSLDGQRRSRRKKTRVGKTSFHPSSSDQCLVISKTGALGLD